MATDDMKPEMIRILKAMFNNDGKMEFKEIVGLLNFLSEQTRYYLDKLETKEFIKPLESLFLASGVISSDSNQEFYELTTKGRAYVMESLMPSDTFSKRERNKRELTKQKRSQMNFYEMGIPEGAILKNKKSNDEVRVIGSKTVAFRGEEMSLTRATLIILNVDYTPSIKRQWLYEGESLHLIYNRVYRNYGKVAIEVTKHIQKTGEHPRTAWNNFAEEIFGEGSSGANKSCPRSAYLGLCEDGLVTGVPSGDYVREQKGKKLNKSYAVQAVRMLCTNPFLENDSPDELWNEVMEALDNVLENHDNQMNVVLALWHEGMIVKTDIEEVDTKYDIYSKRTEHTKVSQVEIPKTLRNQIFSILGEIVGSSEWKSLWRGFCIEKGMSLKEEIADYKHQDLLDDDNLGNNDKAVIEENWLHCRNRIEGGTIEDVFDLVDIAFQFTYKKIQNMYVSGRERWEKEVSYRQAVRNINIRFKEAEVGHQLIRNRIVPVDLNDKDEQKKTKQERIDSLVKWFRKHYQDPVNISPYLGTEDASQLIDDGPYRAKDILVGRFPEESEEIIDASVKKIESAGVILWYSIIKSGDNDKKPEHKSNSEVTHKVIKGKLKTVQKATPLAEYPEWNPNNQKIRFVPVSMNNVKLWKNVLERLHDEITDIKNNNTLSNTHAALIPLIEKLESRLEQYKNSPQRIHDEIETLLSSVQWLEEKQEIASDVHTQRFKKILMDCVLDIRGNVPEVQKVIEKRNNLRLIQLSDDEQDLLTSANKEVIPYIEEEHVEDMEQDVKVFKENPNAVDSQEKTSKAHRWISRMSRILLLLLEKAQGFWEGVKPIVIHKAVEIIISKVLGH